MDNACQVFKTTKQHKSASATKKQSKQPDATQPKWSVNVPVREAKKPNHQNKQPTTGQKLDKSGKKKDTEE